MHGDGIRIGDEISGRKVRSEHKRQAFADIRHGILRPVRHGAAVLREREAAFVQSAVGGTQGDAAPFAPLPAAVDARRQVHGPRACKHDPARHGADGRAVLFGDLRFAVFDARAAVRRKAELLARKRVRRGNGGGDRVFFAARGEPVLQRKPDAVRRPVAVDEHLPLPDGAVRLCRTHGHDGAAAFERGDAADRVDRNDVRALRNGKRDVRIFVGEPHVDDAALQTERKVGHGNGRFLRLLQREHHVARLRLLIIDGKAALRRRFAVGVLCFHGHDDPAFLFEEKDAVFDGSRLRVVRRKHEGIGMVLRRNGNILRKVQRRGRNGERVPFREPDLLRAAQHDDRAGRGNGLPVVCFGADGDFHAALARADGIERPVAVFEHAVLRKGHAFDSFRRTRRLPAEGERDRAVLRIGERIYILPERKFRIVSVRAGVFF